MKRRQFIQTTLLPLLAACNAMPARRVENYKLIGYVGMNTPPTFAVEKLSAINIAFAHINVQGEVALREGDEAFIAKFVALKSRNPALEVLLSVGGWSADGFSDAALNETSRARFAASAADLLARYGLDGIDIDWEYPCLPGPGIRHRSEDRENFTALLAALRSHFDALARDRKRASSYRVTAALADGEFVSGIELDRIHASLDWINLMTYDFHNSLTPTTGHHAGFARSASAPANERTVQAAVAQFLASGTPPRKLIVGVPFYSRAFTEVRDIDHGLNQPYGKYAGSAPWPQLVTDFIDKNGNVRYWDATAQAPYLWNAQTRTFVSYDDVQSMRVKAAFVKAQRLGGMMYWEQSLDPQGELLGVLASALKG